MQEAPSRARLLGLIDSGNAAAAATEAIAALGPPVLRYLRSILHDEDDVADAFSAFAEAVWKGLPSFRWESSLATWAYRIAHRVAVHLRDQPWRRRERRLATGEASQLAESIRTKSCVRAERQREQLEELVAALPVEDQSLFALRIGQRLEWSEIAAVIARAGEPVDASAVAKRFSRLKERVSRMAKERGLLD